MACQPSLIAAWPFPPHQFPRQPWKSCEISPCEKFVNCCIYPDPRRPKLPCIDTSCSSCKPQPPTKFCRYKEPQPCRKHRVVYGRAPTIPDDDRWMDACMKKPKVNCNVICCDDAFDLGINNDFFKYDRNLDLRKAPRKAALENFLFLRNVAEVNQEFNRTYSECAPYERWVRYGDIPEDSIVSKITKSMRLRFEPVLSRWYELEMRPEPKGFIPGSTIYRSRMRPFHKDASFSTPIDDRTHFPTGNRSPFKELRDLKKNM